MLWFFGVNLGTIKLFDISLKGFTQPFGKPVWVGCKEHDLIFKNVVFMSSVFVANLLSNERFTFSPSIPMWRR